MMKTLITISLILFTFVGAYANVFLLYDSLDREFAVSQDRLVLLQGEEAEVYIGLYNKAQNVSLYQFTIDATLPVRYGDNVTLDPEQKALHAIYVNASRPGLHTIEITANSYQSFSDTVIIRVIDLHRPGIIGSLLLALF